MFVALHRLHIVATANGMQSHDPDNNEPCETNNYENKQGESAVILMNMQTEKNRQLNMSHKRKCQKRAYIPFG